MTGGLSWYHWVIILAAFVLLFGAKKLPDAARGVGRSLRILKSEVNAMHEDENQTKKPQQSGETDASAAVPTPTAQLMGTPTTTPQYPAASTVPVMNGVPVVNTPASAPAANPVPVDDQRT